MFSDTVPQIGRFFQAVFVIVVLVFKTFLPASAQELKEFDTDYLETPSSGPDLNAAEEAIVRRTNEFRQEYGLDDLKTNKRLERAAAYFAAYMARTNKYGHEADGNRPWERVSLFNYDYCVVAENIAYQMKSTGFETAELAGKFFEGWKESPRHRENMLHAPVMETGVAIGRAPGSDRYFAVQLFARPQSATIDFQVTNRTGETLRYVVDVAGEDDSESQRQTFELPPRATMFHSRCEPPQIDWGWTESDDGVKAHNGRAYLITKSASGFEVSEQTSDEMRDRS